MDEIAAALLEIQKSVPLEVNVSRELIRKWHSMSGPLILPGQSEELFPVATYPEMTAVSVIAATPPGEKRHYMAFTAIQLQHLAKTLQNLAGLLESETAKRSKQST